MLSLQWCEFVSHITLSGCHGNITQMINVVVKRSNNEIINIKLYILPKQMSVKLCAIIRILLSVSAIMWAVVAITTSLDITLEKQKRYNAIVLYLFIWKVKTLPHCLRRESIIIQYAYIPWSRESSKVLAVVYMVYTPIPRSVSYLWSVIYIQGRSKIY